MFCDDSGIIHIDHTIPEPPRRSSIFTIQTLTNGLLFNLVTKPRLFIYNFIFNIPVRDLSVSVIKIQGKFNPLLIELITKPSLFYKEVKLILSKQRLIK